MDAFFGKPISANNRSRSGWTDFNEAKKYALGLNLKSSKEWREFLKSNKDIEINLPATADRVYAKKGWKSWGDFLGYEDRYREMLDINGAKKVVSKLNIKTLNEWRLYTKSASFDNRLPRDPHSYYAKKGWRGFKDFIGEEE